MQQQILFNTIFNKTENDWDSNSFLISTIEKYPYFGVAHFYALKKAIKNETTFATTAAKTALFFNNPYYLQALLKEDEINKIETEALVTIDSNETESNLNTTQNSEPILKDEVLTLYSENNIAIKENGVNSNIENDNANDKAEPITTLVEVTDSNTESSTSTIEYKEVENIVEIAETTIIQENSNTVQEKEATITNEQEEKSLPAKEEMLFEPLHATDYFASQGIKISDVPFLDDKLGKQLKSFTSWLKTMKKVHPDKLPMVTAQIETAVQNQAAKSNEEAEIVTEAMAEAFIQQGKEIRALDVYEKLSLLNPTKSAYFAAKIDQLKK
jgi:hypothetical protein